MQQWEAERTRRRTSVLSTVPLTTTMEGLTLDPGESVVYQSASEVYVMTPFGDFAVGILLVTNFRFFFRGSRTMQQAGSPRVLEPAHATLLVDIPVNAILVLELQPAQHRFNIPIAPSLFIVSADAQMIYVIENDEDAHIRTVRSHILRCAFPQRIEDVYASQYTGQEVVDLSVRHARASGAARRRRDGRPRMLTFAARPQEPYDQSADPAWLPPASRDDDQHHLDRLLAGIDVGGAASDFLVRLGPADYATGQQRDLPAIVATVTDLPAASIHEVAKYHHGRRLPVLCWRHPHSHRRLLRSAMTTTPRGAQPEVAADIRFCRSLCEEGGLAIYTENRAQSRFAQLWGSELETSATSPHFARLR